MQGAEVPGQCQENLTQPLIVCLFNTHLFSYFQLVNGCSSIDPSMSNMSCKVFIVVATLIMIRLELKLTTTAVKSYSCFPLRPSFIYLTFFEKRKTEKMIVLTKNKIWIKCVFVLLILSSAAYTNAASNKNMYLCSFALG